MRDEKIPERIDPKEHQVFAFLREKKLSQEEKRIQKDFILRAMHSSFNKPYLSHTSFFMNILMFFTHRSFVFSALSVVVVIGSGFGIAKASEGALPGQTLYPLKINVSEPLMAKLKFSDTARIDWEKERVGRRIVEAETLSEQGKLGDIEKTQIEQELYEHRRTLEKIEGHEINDDDFFPESVKSEMKNVNVRVEYNTKDTFIHIEERFETEEDERKEKLNGYEDENEQHVFVDIYSEQGIKMKDVKKTEEEKVKEQKTEKKIVELKKKQKDEAEKQSVKQENDSEAQQDKKSEEGVNDNQDEEKND